MISDMEMMSWGMEVPSPASYFPCSNWVVEPHGGGGCWTLQENKIFEKALAIYDKDTPDRWHMITKKIPGKSVDEVKRRYKELEEDVNHIEAGLVPIPGYGPSSFTLEWVDSRGGFDGFKQPFGGKRTDGARSCDQERKKGVPWTEEEHRLFLMGLKKYGKGDWRNISRNYVISRTPTQVASHAQKYFLRLSTGGKDKRRSSIHDITTANLPDNRPPSPSQIPTLAMMHPGSVVSSDLTDQFPGITDSTKSESGMVFDSLSSQTNKNLFAQTSHGIGSYTVKVKPEYQNSQRSSFHEPTAGNQPMWG